MSIQEQREEQMVTILAGFSLHKQRIDMVFAKDCGFYLHFGPLAKVKSKSQIISI